MDGKPFPNTVVDRIAISSRDPDDGWVLLTVLRVRTQDSRELSWRRIELDDSKEFGGRRWNGLTGRVLPQDVCLEILASVSQGTDVFWREHLTGRRVCIFSPTSCQYGKE